MSDTELDPILSILRHWQPVIGGVIACEPLNPKKTVHLVTTSGGQQYILKEVESGFFASRLEGQFPLLLHLHACGVPVGVPIATGTPPDAPGGDGGALSVVIHKEMLLALNVPAPRI